MSARIWGEDSSAQTGLTSPNRKQADFYLFEFGGSGRAVVPCTTRLCIMGLGVLPHSVVAEQ